MTTPTESQPEPAPEPQPEEPTPEGEPQSFAEQLEADRERIRGEAEQWAQARVAKVKEMRAAKQTSRAS
jgi:hypothetical protein